MQRRFRWSKQEKTAIGLGSLAALVLLLTLVLVIVRRPIQEEKKQDPVEESVSEWSEAVTTLLWIVGEDHPLPTSYVPDKLRRIQGSEVSLVEEAARAFESMCEDMSVPVYPANGYISAAAQQNLYDNMLQKYIDEGYTQERAMLAIAEDYLPGGQDEHQLGLTVDVCADRSLILDVDFQSTEQGKWLRDHAWEYGFVYRDRPDNKSVFKPWQLRYVGEVHAEVMNNLGLTLDEYLRYLEDKKTTYVYKVGTAGKDMVIYFSDMLDSTKDKIKEVSGDNQGHYVIVCYQ